MVRRGALVLGCAAALLGLAGCDGTTSRGVSRIPAGKLLVYSSLPLLGPSGPTSEAVLRGEQIALAAAHGRVGRYRIVLRSLDDATASSGGWNPGQTSADASLASADPRTIGYLGDLDSGASAVSLPILNRADIPQVSPLSTAVGLTRGGPEASPGEPEKYYPTTRRTFARVVPSDRVQSAVQIALQRGAGCTRVFVVYDDEVDGRDTADSFEAAADVARLRVVGFVQYDPSARSYASLARRVAGARPDCVLVSGLLQDHGVAVTDAIARGVPSARVFVTAALGQLAFASPALGGLPRRFDPRVIVTDPTLGVGDYPPAGRRFERRYAHEYGRGGAEAIWGDAAMSLLLDAIRRASDDGRRDVTRTRVLQALFSGVRVSSVLGSFSIDRAGDTSIDRFGVYRLRAGRLVFWKAMRG